MIDHINSQSDNLADIVGMSNISPAWPVSPFIIIASTCILILCLFIFLRHRQYSDQGQLRRIQRQLNTHQLTPRNAAHQIARLNLKKALSPYQQQQLKHLRFKPQNPSLTQILNFIHHVH